MALPALPVGADNRSLVERTNVLVRDYNSRRSAVPSTSLPTSPAVGERWLVSDATAPAFGGALTVGGSAIVPVYWDGTIWRTG
jgi:hypothetical protein